MFILSVFDVHFFVKEGPYQLINKDLFLWVVLVSRHHGYLFKVVAADLKKVGSATFQISLFVKGHRKAQNTIVVFCFV